MAKQPYGQWDDFYGFHMDLLMRPSIRWVYDGSIMENYGWEIYDRMSSIVMKGDGWLK